MKTCSKCKIEKELSEFGSNKGRKDGLHYYCKLCHRETSRKRLATPEGRAAHCKSHLKCVASSPIRQLRYGIAVLVNNSFKRNGWSKSTKTQRLVSCSFEELLIHLQSTFPEWEAYAGELHIDHIVPCCYAETEEALEALQHWSNLQWLPAEENLSKNGTLPADVEERFTRLLAIYEAR